MNNKTKNIISPTIIQNKPSLKDMAIGIKRYVHLGRLNGFQKDLSLPFRYSLKVIAYIIFLSLNIVKLHRQIASDNQDMLALMSGRRIELVQS